MQAFENENTIGEDVGETLNSITNNAEKLNITLFLTSKTISLLGTNIYNFALSLYILKLTGSGGSFAINVLIGMLPRIFLGPFAGVLADRIDRRKCSILLDISSSTAVFLLIGISGLYGLKVEYIYVTSLVLSIINVFYDTALSSSLPNLVNDKNLMKINTYATASSSLSGILSPILGGIIYSFTSINLFLIINGISFLISALLEIFINFNFNKSAKQENGQNKSFRSDLKEIIGFIKNQKILSSLFKFSLLLNLFGNAAFAVTYPYIINKVLKMTAAEFGTIEAFFSIGLLIASLVLGSMKERQKKMKSVGLGLTATGFLMIFAGLPTLDLSLFNSRGLLFIFYILTLFITGILMVIINAPMMVIMQRLTPDHMRGRLMGMLGTLCSGIAPIGIIVTGLIIDKIPSFCLLLVSGLVIIAISLVILKNKTLREI